MSVDVDMPKHILFYFLTVLVLGGCTSKSVIDRGVSSEPDPEVSAENYQTLLNGMKAYVRTTETPTLLYSWCHSCTQDNSQASLKKYVAERTGNFWDLSKKDEGMLGNGMYFALDPVASRNYGGDQGWVLAQAELKKGINYIVDPVGHEKSNTPTKDYYSQLSYFGCSLDNYRPLNVQTLLEVGAA